MIWIMGGTSETSEFIEKISGKRDYIVTVATSVGRDLLKDKHVTVVRLDSKGMVEFIKCKDIDTVIDLTHPYAVLASKNAREACEKSNIRYLRFLREKTREFSDIIEVDGIDDCRSLLKNLKGTVFFTTGSKNISDFEAIRGENRFIYRVLPSNISLDECEKHNIALRDIVAILGPFSVELNKILFSEFNVEYVVMKDSGERGGTEEKLVACKELGIKAIMIKRDKETGVSDLDELVELIL